MAFVLPCRRPLSSTGFDAPTAARRANTKVKMRRKEKALMMMTLLGRRAFDAWLRNL